MLLLINHSVSIAVSCRYLTEHLTSPSTIPINVQLTVPEKSFVVRDVLLRPEDSMGAILKKLKSLMEVKGMKIVEFPACNEFEVSIIRCWYTLHTLTHTYVTSLTRCTTVHLKLAYPSQSFCSSE